LIQSFVRALELKFFLRGAISHGRYYLSNLLIIGRAIDEVAHAHNQIQMIGIFTTPNFSKHLFTNGVSFEINSYIRYDNVSIKPNVQTKQDNYDGIALNWPRNDKTLKLYHILRNEINNQKDDNVKQKYINTLKFYNVVRTDTL
jgi:hypothetical protein